MLFLVLFISTFATVISNELLEVSYYFDVNYFEEFSEKQCVNTTQWDLVSFERLNVVSPPHEGSIGIRALNNSCSSSFPIVFLNGTLEVTVMLRTVSKYSGITIAVFDDQDEALVAVRYQRSNKNFVPGWAVVSVPIRKHTTGFVQISGQSLSTEFVLIDSLRYIPDKSNHSQSEEETAITNQVKNAPPKILSERSIPDDRFIFEFDETGSGDDDDDIEGGSGDIDTEPTVPDNTTDTSTEYPGMGTENPGTENPGTENPGTENPGTEDPGTENPGTEEPGTENPGTEDPGTDNPETEDPGSDNPVTEDPGTEDPGTEDPGTEDPGTENPGTEDPVTEDPGTENPGTEDPGTDNPVTEDPGTDNPGTGDPGTENPGTEEPETENPGTEDPGTENPGTEDPGTENPGTEEPETENPGTEDPETENPVTENPGTEDPGTENPGTENPGTNPGTDNTEDPNTDEDAENTNSDSFWNPFTITIVAVGAFTGLGLVGVGSYYLGINSVTSANPPLLDLEYLEAPREIIPRARSVFSDATYDTRYSRYR